MTFRPTTTTIIGITVGGGVGILIVLLVIMFAFLRRSHKRLLSTMNTAGERRLRKHAGGHLSITDEDVARMPATRAPLRRSPNAPYARIAPYTPMASRLDAASGGALETPPRAMTDERNKEELLTASKSWPLPRRLTRSNAIPLSTVRYEPSAAKKPEGPHPKSSPARTSSGNLPSPLPKFWPEDLRSLTDQGLRFELHALQPKPLFHGQQRSISHGMLSQLAQKTSETHDAKHRIAPPSIQHTSKRPHLPRSSSLWSHDPGIVPDRPVPLLPVEGALQRLTRVKRFQESNSRREFEILSDNTAILDGSRIFSQADTELTLPSVTSPPVAESQGNAPSHQDFHGEIHVAAAQGKKGPVEPTMSLTVQSHLELRKPQRASVQVSLPRSDSSGISKYIGYNWSHNTSETSLYRSGSESRHRSKVNVPSSAEKRKPRRVVSPLSNNATLNGCPDRQGRRASTSILQIISGNEGSLRADPWDNRPLSFATSEPFEWDPNMFLQPGKRASKIPGTGHKRRNCVRISSIPAVVPKPSPKPDNIKEREEAYQVLQKAIGSLKQPRVRRSTFRPPSAKTFDPQLELLTTPSAEGEPQTHTRRAFPYSPTACMYNLYNKNGSPEPSPISTPTHKPRHPNRVNAIFNNTDTTPSRLCNTSNDVSQLDRSLDRFDIFRFDEERSAMNSPAFRNSTSPSKFPLPPRDPSGIIPISATSASPKRGSQPLHSGFSLSQRRSPTRGILKNSSPSPKRHSKSLSTSIMALRRMNSEANDNTAKGRVSREYKRYLSLSGDDGPVAEDGDGNEDSGKENQVHGPSKFTVCSRNEQSLRNPRSERRWWRNSGNDLNRAKEQSTDGEQRGVKGPRPMPYFDPGTMITPTKESGGFELEETPGSMYDDIGFLKE